MPTDEAQGRLRAWADAWNVTVEACTATASSLIAFGHRQQLPVVLKVVRAGHDEWHVGAVLAAFGGLGVVQVLDVADGTVLMDRVVPGTPLTHAVTDDERATAVLAETVSRMAPQGPPPSCPSVESLAGSFECYMAGTDHSIPRALVHRAQETYRALCRSQGTPRLLHGDLHHGNVLLDRRLGWLAVDPKGMVGEPAYDLGPALRNPAHRPDVYGARHTITRRTRYLAQALALDEQRIMEWAFAQAVLAALWELEDDGVLTRGHGWLAFAGEVSAILDA